MLALFFGCWPVHSESRIVLYLHSPFLYLCSPYTHPDTKKKAISRVTNTHTKKKNGYRTIEFKEKHGNSYMGTALWMIC